MKEFYKILRSKDLSSLPLMEAELLANNPGWITVFKRYFLSNRSQITELPEEEGAVSYIIQKPLDGRGEGVLLYIVEGAEVTRSGNTTVVEDGPTRQYWTAGLVSSDNGSGAQTSKILETYEKYLGKEEMTIEANCIRTWFFVDDIDNNYAGMVKARRENFELNGLTPNTHYIASTGIHGTPVSKDSLVQMDAYAVKGDFSQKYLYALSHLSRTIDYGVTFERGTEITYSGREHFLISGTASIDNKGRIMHVGDVMAQSGRMFENIEALLSEGGSSFGDIKFAITYLRNESDAEKILPVLDSKFGEIPHILVLAPVCRPDWLVETECIAMRG